MTTKKAGDIPQHDAAANSAASEIDPGVPVASMEASRNRLDDAANTYRAVADVNAQAAENGLRKARVRLADITDKMQVEYIRPNELAKMGAVNIVDGHVLKRRGEFGVQCEYEVEILTGQHAGSSAFLTLNESPMRRKLVELVQRYGSVGPVLLRPVGKEIQGNQPWGFVEPGTPEAEGVTA